VDLFKCKVLNAYAFKTLHIRKSNPLLFLTNTLQQWLNSSKSCGFDESQGFALRINRFAVYSVDIIVMFTYKQRGSARSVLFPRGGKKKDR